jgi:hypothetical protein
MKYPTTQGRENHPGFSKGSTELRLWQAAAYERRNKQRPMVLMDHAAYELWWARDLVVRLKEENRRLLAELKRWRAEQ